MATSHRFKRFDPTPDQRKVVRAAAQIGLPRDRIALLVINPHSNNPISERTLQYKFKDELRAGSAAADFKVLKTLVEMASSGDSVAATIFYAKCRLGWREQIDVEHKGSVSVNRVPVPGVVSLDEWQRVSLAEHERRSREMHKKMVDAGFATGSAEAAA